MQACGAALLLAFHWAVSKALLSQREKASGKWWRQLMELQLRAVAMAVEACHNVLDGVLAAGSLLDQRAAAEANCGLIVGLYASTHLLWSSASSPASISSLSLQCKVWEAAGGVPPCLGSAVAH